MKERDVRQLKLMRARIEDYEQKIVPLSVLIGDLEFLLDAIEEIESVWREQVRAEWGALEESYAVMLDEGRHSLSSNEERVVAEAIGNLKKLLSNVPERDTEGDGTTIT